MFSARAASARRGSLEQMELEPEDIEAAAAEDELAAEQAAPPDDDVRAFSVFPCRKPSRKPSPAHLPRERVVLPGPTACT